MIYVYPETRRVGGSGNGPRTRVIRERVVILDSKRIGRLQVEQDGTLFWHPEVPSPLAAGLAFADTHAFVKAHRAAASP